jgi:hypothetical protein
MEAVPTVIDQVRALVTQRAALIAQRVQIDGDVSWIDEQLEEARQLLGVTLAPPAAAPTPVQARPVSAPVVTAPAAPPATPAHPFNDRQQEILALLQTHGPLPTRAIAGHLKIERLVCKMALQRMRKVGLLGSVASPRFRSCAAGSLSTC